MKAVIALTILIGSISAVPWQNGNQMMVTKERLVTNAIENAIKDAAQSIRDAGLDPLVVKREAVSYALPVPVIFNAAAFVEELLSTGLSNIVINNLNYGILTSRLTFDIELPLVSASVDEVGAQATFFGNNFEAEGSGSIAIRRIRVTGNVRVSIGIISGISIRSVTVNFSLGGIDSNLNLVIQGTDYSGLLNTFFGFTIPKTLDAYSSEINELLEIILLDILRENL